ncbi:hypothetical protein NW814_00150 [Synechococcus sp. R65.1]|uniref:hypothetical protein n=1 Tax=Synechococcus sp. R65.1 TaxID=2964524 RepID=UPI0039C3617F
MSFSLGPLLRQSWQRLAPFSIQVLLPSLALTGLEIFLISLWSKGDDYASIFKGLTQRDSYWYLSIVRRGYQFVGFDKIAYEQSNVAFFPGYPLAVAITSRLLGVEPELGLYLTAQLFCWLMWIYLFLFYRRWQIPTLWQVLASLIILVYPSSFYLVVGYSESLFVASLLGFFYWSMDLNSLRAALLAGAHGLAMSATRIVGLPVALLPLLRLGEGSRRWFWTAGAAVLALLGGLSFFLYCQLRFGRWDLYIEMQRYFTGVQANYQALFQASTYVLSPERWQVLLSPSAPVKDAGLWSDALSQLFVSVTLGSLVVTGLLDGLSVLVGKSRCWQERLGFHLAAWAMFYIAVAGMSPLGQRSMIRYCLPVHIVQVLALVHWAKYTDFSFIPERIRPYLGNTLKLGYVLLAFIFFALNQILTWRYAHHLWVA